MSLYSYPPKKGENYQEFEQDDYSKSGSSMDCTGLIPSAVHSDEEFYNYNELYPFLPPESD